MDFRFKLSLSQLLRLKNHIGGKLSTIQNSSGAFIFGHRWSITILDVRLSILYIRRALVLITQISYKNGQVFFYGNSLQISHFLQELIPFWQKRIKKHRKYNPRSIFNMATPRRWWGGFLTNFKKWSRWFNYMGLYCKKFYYYGWKKPEIMAFLRKITNRFIFEDFFYISYMIPPILISFDLISQPLIKNEAFKLNIPLISFVNNNINPIGVCYPIVSACHSSLFEFYLLSLFLISALIGRGRRVKQFRNGLLKIRRYLLKYKKYLNIESNI